MKQPEASSSKPSSARKPKSVPVKAQAKVPAPVVEDESMDEDNVDAAASSSHEDDPDVGEEEIDPEEDFEEEEGVASQK